MYVCMYECMYVCVYVHVCVCMYVYVYVHVCVCMHVCVCVRDNMANGSYTITYGIIGYRKDCVVLHHKAMHIQFFTCLTL